MSSHPAGLEERYGVPRPGVRRAVVGGSALVAVLGLSWLGWTAYVHSTPRVASEIVSFRVLDEHQVTARVDVRVADADVAGSCTLRAFAEDHTIVGEARFEVGGARFVDGARIARAIRTERRATAVELLGCTAPDQPRPR